MNRVVSLIACIILAGQAATGQSGWFWQNPRPNGNNLLAVKVIDNNTIVATGAYGTILRTTNAGGTWSIQTPPSRPYLYGVDFGSSLVGVAVGSQGTILRTIDGGISWSAISSGTTRALNAVDIYPTGFGLAVGSMGTILRSCPYSKLHPGTIFIADHPIRGGFRNRFGLAEEFHKEDG
jgi:photosystem II stability/assembly factor-like uncharacterized protein